MAMCTYIPYTVSHITFLDIEYHNITFRFINNKQNIFRKENIECAYVN